MRTVPTVDDLLSSTAIGNGFHRWNVKGGSVYIDSETLRQALEEAYDPFMSGWPAMVDLGGDY